MSTGIRRPDHLEGVLYCLVQHPHVHDLLTKRLRLIRYLTAAWPETPKDQWAPETREAAEEADISWIVEQALSRLTREECAVLQDAIRFVCPAAGESLSMILPLSSRA